MRESFIFYKSFYDSLKGMDEKTQGKCLMALADYALNGTEPHCEPEVMMFFILAKPQIDANNQRYENGCKGGRPKNQTETKAKPKNNQTETNHEPNDNDNVNVNVNVNEKENILKEKVAKAPTFKKPTLDEVKAYCQERNNGVDAEKWMDHYTANGWKVGKNPMRDWKATVRTWERLETRKQVENKTSEPIKLMDFIDQMERREAIA